MTSTTAGDRIRERRTVLRYSQRSLGEKLGVSGPAVSQWENDQTFPEEHLWSKLAEVLECDIRYILHGDSKGKALAFALDDSVLSMAEDQVSLRIPVLSWVQAGQWTETETVTIENVKEWLPYAPEAGKNGFALIVQGESMSPYYLPNDRIYVNPDYQLSDLHTGDLVVVSCDGTATFKKLIIDGSSVYMESLNKDYPGPKYIELTENCRLVGLVVGSYRPIFRRNSN